MNLVITGANRGIGLELTRQSLARGNTVHAGARDAAQARELTGLAGASGGRLHVHALDVASDESVRAFAAALTGPVDLLINNAGLRTRRDDIEGVSLEDALQMLQVNALGTLRVTRALLPRLRETRGAKIASLSSGLGSIADNTSGGSYGYRMSKAALNMAMRSLAQDLRGEGLIAVAISPGWVQTDMGGSSAPTQVSESAAGLLAVLDRLTLPDSGSFFDFRGERIAW
ncbi:SDR family oxidoreductase [Corallococcus llansteffanensis]|uniref:SDR family oxidoreductase n=1 Tax=Corallococcus llansteffanensis TaxID=2316731 RepID=A0A3A8PMZ6_9BACT|nr:SDR family oxidoreductase [Corallococcus llansteffanensis]RKH57733.1 SDR family oxidoreductase [Corallococcus llansteffanensis]